MKGRPYAMYWHTYCVFIHMYFELLTCTLIAVLVIWECSKGKARRLPDRKVRPRHVARALAAFSPRTRRLRGTYSEKSLQEQLGAFLRERFDTVVAEHGVASYNATRIDFDIGGGRVGIEVKLARSLSKSPEFHRLSGQLESYVEHRYGDGNLIVAVFGERRHTRNRALLARIRRKVEAKSATYAYGEIVAA